MRLIDLKSEYITARNRFEWIGKSVGKATREELVDLAVRLGTLTKEIKRIEHRLFSRSKK
jgi:hypothetical protein